MPAERNATTRSGSCAAGSRPKSGVDGNKLQSTLPGNNSAHPVNPNAHTKSKLPSDSARPDALCAPSKPAARTSSELCSTSEYAKRTFTNIAMNIVIVTVSADESGRAHHSDAIN